MIRASQRLGLVQMGQGGSALNYSFDSDGLSNDPQLPIYMQSLTPSQLQTALNGGDPLPGLIQTTNDLINGVGLPCGTAESGDPNCTGGAPGGAGLSSVPMWAWLVGGGLVAFSLFRK